MTAQVLILLLDGHRVGEVRRNGQKLSLHYDPAWREDVAAYPVSLSMPLAAADHPHAPINAFIWGLLPDNEQVLDRWARQFHVSARNPFALIGAVGEDCAGAVQFVTPDRAEALMKGDEDGVQWLDEAQIEDRLRTLRQDHSAWRDRRDHGQFSLAGAQPKTALLQRNGQWGVPSGRNPTSHILKPPTGAFDGHAENEHFCLRLAARLGLPVAWSEVRRFGGEIAIVVERYDRRMLDGRLLRIHQEDICQALGVPPTRKYQADQGPNVKRCVTLIRDQSSEPGEDVQTFVQAVLFNWIIGGTDAHAKNYSLLIAEEGQVRLAPLYDISSALPYDGLQYQRLKLAMKLGGEYYLRDIGPRQVAKMAVELRQDPVALIARAKAIADQIATDAPLVAEDLAAAGLDHVLIPRLRDVLVDRATRLSAALAV